MWKNSFVIIAIGSLVTGSNFATPLHVKKMFMKDQMMKSSLASHNHAQNSQFKFSGTWTGMCSYDGENEEVKVKINEDNTELSIIDLINEGESETHSFNVVESESRSDKDWYDSFTNRLTRVNENTLRFEGTGMFGPQLPSSNKEKEFASVVFTSMLTVDNNQLIIDTNGIISQGNKNKSSEGKCILKRAG